jgi:hypothetical protein
MEPSARSRSRSRCQMLYWSPPAHRSAGRSGRDLSLNSDALRNKRRALRAGCYRAPESVPALVALGAPLRAAPLSQIPPLHRGQAAQLPDRLHRAGSGSNAGADALCRALAAGDDRGRPRGSAARRHQRAGAYGGARGCSDNHGGGCACWSMIPSPRMASTGCLALYPAADWRNRMKLRWRCFKRGTLPWRGPLLQQPAALHDPHRHGLSLMAHDVGDRLDVFIPFGPTGASFGGTPPTAILPTLEGQGKEDRYGAAA